MENFLDKDGLITIKPEQGESVADSIMNKIVWGNEAGTLTTRQKKILVEKHAREMKQDYLEDIGRDSTTDPETRHENETYFSGEEYNQE